MHGKTFLSGELWLSLAFGLNQQCGIIQLSRQLLRKLYQRSFKSQVVAGWKFAGKRWTGHLESRGHNELSI